MEDYVYQIRKYLPLKFADNEANDFLKYLAETYLENIKNRKYQFAFKAFHMLYMTCIYKFSWFIKITNKESPEEKTYKLKIKDDGRAQVQEETVSIKELFEYSLISESEAIQRLLGKTGFHPNDFDNCNRHVEARNHCSHASGRVEYDEKGIDFLISDELKYVERLQNKIKPELKKFLEIFLEENWHKSLISGDIENIFIANNISRKDLELVIGIDLPLFKKGSSSEKVVFRKILYLIFISEAQKYFDTEINIFVEKLPMFAIGLKDEVNIRINGEEKVKSMREIIEESLVPIINSFTQQDREKAEKILNL
ncbi:MAG: hypothetical protein WC621_02710 [Patescibacteria group bacterium]